MFRENDVVVGYQPGSWTHGRVGFVIGEAAVNEAGNPGVLVQVPGEGRYVADAGSLTLLATGPQPPKPE